MKHLCLSAVSIQVHFRFSAPEFANDLDLKTCLGNERCGFIGTDCFLDHSAPVVGHILGESAMMIVCAFHVGVERRGAARPVSSGLDRTINEGLDLFVADKTSSAVGHNRG